ncbi:MAG: hypothetical protein GEU71_10710 [Actinobacteria bacterium]|nr:hypothetical protein [Actinomycetota bacterium]
MDETPIVVVDLETGETRTLVVPEFGPGDAQFAIAPIGGRIVFRGPSGTEAGAYVIDRDLENDPVLLGKSWYFVPSATVGRVWLTTLDPDSPSTVRDLESVREVTVDGEVTVPETGPPPRASIVGAVRQGLIVQKDGLQVWDPRTDRIVTRIDGVFPVDTSGDVVAWCDKGCPEIHLTDVANGTDRVIEPPVGVTFSETYNGAFSPDDRFLAVPVRNEEGEQVAVIDVESLSARLVPNSGLSVYQLMTWSTSGDWLVFDTGEGHLSMFHPDTGRSATIPLDPTKTFFSLTAL